MDVAWDKISAELIRGRRSSLNIRDTGGAQNGLYGLNYPSIKPLIIDQNSVEKILQNLNVDKASGEDNLPCCLLKESAEELVHILTCNKKQSIETSTLPRLWLRSSRRVPDVSLTWGIMQKF